MADAPEYKELKAGWQDKVEVRTYTKQEVAKHNTKGDTWIIIHGKVYDVSEYLRDHPGGPDVLREVAGKEATSEYEDVGHSEDAGEIMHGLLVGVVEGAVEAASEKPAPPAATVTVHRTEPEGQHAATKSTIGLRTELALLATGAAGLSYLANSYHLLPSFSAKSRTSQALAGHGSFTQGFLTATIALGIAGMVGANYLSKVLNTEKAFNAYPPHMQSRSPKPPSFKPAGVLQPTIYQRFKLRQKTELSDGIYRFVFDLPTKYSILGLPIGQHVAIRATIDGHTVVRSYTPVSNNRDLGRLELLIRVYPQGAMGNYLKNLDIGDYAEIRGPKGAMKYRRGMSKEIGMVGGGTGITPLFQVIRAICEDDKDDTRISLIYGNRSESDIMLKEKIDAYASKVPHKLQVHYTLDSPSDAWTGGRGYVDRTLLQDKMPAAVGENKVLLCGPPGMVNAVKGNLVALGFEQPGAVGKATDQVFCF